MESQLHLYPKLRSSDVHLQGFGLKMRVRPAAQVLSHSLASVIHSQLSVKFLLTRRFNQDALENCFSQVQTKNRNDDRPDSVRFEAAFRFLAVQSLFHHSVQSNCEDDLDDFLMDIASYSKQQKSMERNVVAESGTLAAAAHSISSAIIPDLVLDCLNVFTRPKYYCIYSRVPPHEIRYC